MLSNFGYAVTHPLEEMRQMTRRMEDVVQNLNIAGYHPFQPREQHELGTEPSMHDWGWRPKMDVLESGNSFKVLLELPGWKREDLDVQLNGRYLSITGKRGPWEREDKHTGERWTYWRRERWSENFHRAVALPEGIDGENITAVFKDGLLQLTIPKHGGKFSQRVTILGSEEHVALEDIHKLEDLERQRRQNRGDLDRKAARKLFEIMRSSIGKFPRLKHVTTQEKKTFAIHDTATSRPAATRRSWKWLDRMEEQERQRRMKQGDMDRKASKKLLDVVRGGISSGAMQHLHKSGWQDVDRMEDQERKRRMQQGDMDRQAARKLLESFRNGTARGLPQLKKTTTRRISISNIASNIRSQKNLQDVNRLEEQERIRRIQQGDSDKQASEKLLKVVKESQPPKLHHIDTRRRNINISGPSGQ